MRVILGSQPPHRREILKFFSLLFVVAPPDFDKDQSPLKGAKTTMPKQLQKHPTDTILTTDTKDDQESFIMLKKLHYRGFYKKRDKPFSGFELTWVIFSNLTEREIRAFIKGPHGKDKAGGYGAQEVDSLLVKRIEGCFYNVLGLPINLLREKLS